MMSISIELEALFLKWRIAQVELDGNDEFLNNSAYVFTPDGLIGTEYEYKSARSRILYILTESHTTEENYQVCDFWFKRQINLDEKWDQNNLIVRRIRQMQKFIMNSDDVDYKSVAYMNINKNGCKKELKGSLNKNQWRKYSNHFSKFIKEQIKILSPTIIVCCGSYDQVKKSLGELTDTMIVVKMYHPSFTRPIDGKSYNKDQNYMELFEKRYEEAKERYSNSTLYSHF